MKLRVTVSALVVAVLLVSGCSGAFVKVAPLPPAGYERLGHVEGSGCGSLAIAWGPWAFIPIGLDSRLERARAAALAQRPGATALVDVRITERWYWYFLALTRCITVSGEAIR